MEEERRLCYVGMTRAEKRLILTWAKYRRRFGGGEQERSMPSRFLKEIPANLVISLGISDDDEYDGDSAAPQVELSAERDTVRQESRRNLYTGKTYNSLENVSEFFKQRGVNVPIRGPVTQPARTPAPAAGEPRQAMQGGLFSQSLPEPKSAAGNRPPWEEPSIQLRSQPVPPPKPWFAPSGAPAQPRLASPQPPVSPKRPPSTGTVVEHPKYGRGTIVRREGEGSEAKIVVSFDRYGLKKLVEKYAGLRKA
jgi:DNA helicase-2/ATP-dependent DNA helicase PcrA